MKIKMEEVVKPDWSCKDESGGIDRMYITYDDGEVEFQLEPETSYYTIFSNTRESMIIVKLFFPSDRILSHDYSKLRTNHLFIVDNMKNEWVINQPEIRVIHTSGKNYIDFTGMIIRYTSTDFYKIENK